MAANPDDFKQRYFAEIAPKYSNITGNATKSLFHDILNTHSLSINSESIIHDNAAGPGTATEVLIPWCQQQNITPNIIVTDYVPAMIEAFETIRTKNLSSSPMWEKVDAKVIDSSDLSSYSDSTFSHSICNFSIFALTHPKKSLQEIYRTLKPGGIALITTWKRFAVSDLLATAQDIVKGEDWGKAHRVPPNGPEYFQEGYMAGIIREAGWSSIEEFSLSHAVKEGEDWNGLYDFLTNSSIKNAATREWSDQELARWPEAIQSAFQQEKEKFGGVGFEAWAVIARK